MIMPDPLVCGGELQVESLIEAFVAAHWGRLLADLGVAKPTIVNKLKGFLGLEAGSASDLKREPSISPRKALEKIEEVHVLHICLPTT